MTVRSCLRYARPAASGRRTRRGAAVVEFAIVAPVFFILVIGIIEVGRAMMVQQVIINASRVGARHAVTLPATMQSSIDAAVNYADNVGVGGISVTVAPDPATADPGDEVTVTASVNFSDVTWAPTPWFMGGKLLVASSVMRKEGF